MNFKFNIQRAYSHIPDHLVGKLDGIKFPVEWPEAIEELKFIVPLIPKYHEYTRNLSRVGAISE